MGPIAIHVSGLKVNIFQIIMSSLGDETRRFATKVEIECVKKKVNESISQKKSGIFPSYPAVERDMTTFCSDVQTVKIIDTKKKEPKGHGDPSVSFQKDIRDRVRNKG